MTYSLVATRKKPLGLWILDEESPADRSGYSRTAVTNANTHTSLGGGAEFSTVFNNENVGYFESPLFVSGYEKQEFSLEVLFRVVDNSSAPSYQQILGHTGQMDGITINGTIVSFGTKYENTGEATASYDIQIPRSIHAVGVHTLESNLLYVNGELVAEQAISMEQQLDTFASSDGFLYSGESESTYGVALNSVAIYPLVLSGLDIIELYESNTDVPDSFAIPTLYGGLPISTSLSAADIFLNQKWSTDYDWSTGFSQGVSSEDGVLRPQVLNGISTDGSWLTIFDISSSDTDSIHSVNASWLGLGVLVEASLDNETWETVERGKSLDIIPQGFDPTDKVLNIRVSFVGGIENDPSYIDYLNFIGIRQTSVQINGIEVVTTQPATMREEHDPIELYELWGAQLLGGSLTIENTGSVGTQEFWVKRLDETDVVISPAGGNFYINGINSSLSNLDIGEWSLVHIKRSTPLTEVQSISGNLIVGRAAVYEEDLPPETLKDIYMAYTRTPLLTTSDNSNISVTEYAEPVDIYAHTWSITGAG